MQRKKLVPEVSIRAACSKASAEHILQPSQILHAGAELVAPGEKYSGPQM